MNTWNPGMARCLTQGEFYEQYRGFVMRRREEHLLRKVACIHGRPVDLWHLYNLVTQLGGWATIYHNRWQSLLYCDKPEWAHHTDIGNRLKVIYTKYLLPFEEVHFCGKRYDNPEEASKLFVPLSRRAQQGYTTSCLRGDRRLRFSVNARVWVKGEDFGWWPGKVVEEDEFSGEGTRQKLGARPVRVRLYDRSLCVWTTRQSLEPFVPNARLSTSEALKRAVDMALADISAIPLGTEAGPEEDVDWAEDTSSQGVSSETTEGSDPKFDLAESAAVVRPRGRPPKQTSLQTPRAHRPTPAPQTLYHSKVQQISSENIDQGEGLTTA